MRQLLKHKVTWLTRIFFILVSFFALQIHVIPVLANSIDVGQKHHVGIAGSELVPDPGNPAAYPSTWASADIDPFRPVPDYSSNVFTTILQVAPFTSDVIDIVNTVKAIGEGKWGDAVWSGIFLLPYSDAAKLPKLVSRKATVGVAKTGTQGVKLFPRFTAISGKTTTILGRLTDTRPLANNLGNVKSGMNKGGFNILNIPDEYYSWVNNKKWLQRAINRSDIIKAASPPTPANLFKNGVSGKRTIYGMEVEMLEKAGYRYDASTFSFIK